MFTCKRPEQKNTCTHRHRYRNHHCKIPFKFTFSGPGYKVSSEEECQLVISGCVEISNNLFSVPSRSKPQTFYAVDMNIGRCECPVGSDGSPCFHQYLLWSKQIASNYNFIPKFDEKARQKFALIALGKSLNQEFYKPLHTSLLKTSLDLEDQKTEPENTSERTWSNKINKNDSTFD